MDRLTRVLADSDVYVVTDAAVHRDANGYSGEAITKLAKFENVYDGLLSHQKQISSELDKLRLENKTNTVKFKQLLANKITNNNIILLFEEYGL